MSEYIYINQIDSFYNSKNDKCSLTREIRYALPPKYRILTNGNKSIIEGKMLSLPMIIIIISR